MKNNIKHNILENEQIVALANYTKKMKQLEKANLGETSTVALSYCIQH